MWGKMNSHLWFLSVLKFWWMYESKCLGGGYISNGFTEIALMNCHVQFHLTHLKLSYTNWFYMDTYLECFPKYFFLLFLNSFPKVYIKCIILPNLKTVIMTKLATYILIYMNPRNLQAKKDVNCKCAFFKFPFAFPQQTCKSQNHCDQITFI